MNKKSILFLVAAAVVVVLIIVIVSGGGLNSRTRELLTAESTALSQQLPAAQQRRGQIQAQLQGDPALFADVKLQWDQNLAHGDQLLAAAQAEIAGAQTLAEQDDDNHSAQIDTAVKKANTYRVQVQQLHESMFKDATYRAQFKQNRAQFVTKALSQYSSLKSASVEQTRNAVARAGTDWPEKKAALDTHFGVLNGLVQSADSAQQVIQTENVKVPTAINWPQLIGAVKNIDQAATRMGADQNRLLALTGQLYTSWDKILEDMEVVDGPDVEFYHTYRVVKITITDMATRASTHDSQHSRVKITETDWKNLKEMMGMTVESKPAGKFDHEATKVAQPAGYAYMCPPSQRSNQYGYWHRQRGSSVWAWYGQYAFMRSLFWGGRNSMVYDRYYNDYHRYNSGRRTYFGGDTSGRKRYGTSGTTTRARYGTSKYIKSGGFRNSKYVSSGGKFRGTRYVKAKSRSYKSSRGSSFRSSRSGSSSRFRGGK